MQVGKLTTDWWAISKTIVACYIWCVLGYLTTINYFHKFEVSHHISRFHNGSKKSLLVGLCGTSSFF